MQTGANQILTEMQIKKKREEKYITGSPCLMIPDFAIAIPCREPPKEAKCPLPTVVMTEDASSVLCMTFVTSLAPPRPA
jgi:hypothetical protein